ncbi:MAG: tandem-95 repeat protein [Burkholderiaceae bacterium]|nr:tandem-95 repeat protein [Burkholderiaceae bacterium]
MAFTTDVTTIRYSGDLRVDALLNVGPAWNYLLPSRTTLYFTFDLGAISGKAAGPVSGFNATQQSAVAAILAHVGIVTGISFAQVASSASADLHFGSTNISGANTFGQTTSTSTYSSGPGGVLTSYSADAYVFLDNVEFASANAAPVAGSSGFEVLLHEIGHALGLGHPFDDPHRLPGAQDNTANTVMSYTHVGGPESQFQPYDLLALSWIYGTDGLGGDFGYNSRYGPSLTLDPPPDVPPPDEPPADDFPATRFTPGAVAVGGASAGTLESAGDRDWFAVSLQAGARYIFELLGAASGDGTLADPSLRLLSAAGGLLASNDDAGGSTNARIAYTATATGAHYLEASSAIAGGTGTYSVVALRDLSNRAPVAAPDAYSTSENGPVSGNVLDNDSDPDGQVLLATLASSPVNGSVSLQANGQFTYTPKAGFSGNDVFGYRASDGSLSTTALVSVVVAAVNEAPIAQGATITVAEDASRSGTLPVAVDPDGDALTYALASAAQHGVAAVGTNGTYTYTPRANYNGNDSFVYRVSDGILSSSATIAVNVTPVNDAPVASGASISTDEDTPVSGMLPKASDVDADPITYSKALDPAHGTVAIAASGQYTYTPAQNFNGADRFEFRVGDAGGAGTTYAVSISVRAVRDELIGTSGNDTLTDHSGDASLRGLAGDDRLRGGSGNDAIDGGPGVDTAIYSGMAREYVVAKTASGWSVTHSGEADGADTLVSVERLEFADRAFELLAAPRPAAPGYGVNDWFLFDPVFYSLGNSGSIATQGLDGAWEHFQAVGAAQGKAPTSWFDASYYENKWLDLAPLRLDDALLFRHFNLFGVWEGRSPGPAFERFDGNRYLAQNPDVAGYVDAFIADFLGSRTNGAIAHYILFGAAEGREAVDLVGQVIDLGYTIDLGL